MEQEPQKPRKPRQRKKVDIPDELKGMPHFNCPNCNYDLFIAVESEHIYDHIMECPECFDRMADHVFSRFVELGVAMNTSFIRQAMKYVDEFMHIRMQEEGEVE